MNAQKEEVTVDITKDDLYNAIRILRDASETIDVALHDILDIDLHDKDKRILRISYMQEQERIDNLLLKWLDEFGIE